MEKENELKAIMIEQNRKVLMNIKKNYGTKTAYELYRIVEKLAKEIREESRKESDNKKPYKSAFTDGE